jgi:hypothetical protein
VSRPRPIGNKGRALKPSKILSLFWGCLVLHELGSADFRSASRYLRLGSPRTWAPAPVAPRGRLGEGGELMRHRRPLRKVSKFHGEVPPRRPGGSGNVTQTSAREVQRAHPVISIHQFAAKHWRRDPFGSGKKGSRRSWRHFGSRASGAEGPRGGCWPER